MYSFTSRAYLNGQGWRWCAFGQQRKGTVVDSGADSEQQRPRSPEIVSHYCNNYQASISCVFAFLLTLSHHYTSTIFCFSWNFGKDLNKNVHDQDTQSPLAGRRQRPKVPWEIFGKARTDQAQLQANHNLLMCPHICIFTLEKCVFVHSKYFLRSVELETLSP